MTDRPIPVGFTRASDVLFGDTSITPSYSPQNVNLALAAGFQPMMGSSLEPPTTLQLWPRGNLISK